MNTVKRIADLRQQVLAKIEALDGKRQRLSMDLADIDAAERVWRRYLVDGGEPADFVAVVPTSEPTSLKLVREFRSTAKMPDQKPMSKIEALAAVLRAASPNVLERQAIIDWAKESFGIALMKDTATTALMQLKERGVVRSVGRNWQFIEPRAETSPVAEDTEPPTEVSV